MGIKRLKSILFNIWVAVDMLLCAVLLAPFGSLPRETISGFIGRQALMNKKPMIVVAKTIDWFARERGHCGETAMAESDAYDYLYPEQRLPNAPLQVVLENGSRAPSMKEAIIDSIANSEPPSRLH